MQVVPENLNITNGYQVFETPDALYINNQAYDKFTMEPKPFDFYNYNDHLTHKNMLKNQINLLEYNYVVPFKEPNYSYIIQDNQDSNIFYCLTETGATDSNQYICKFKKENDKWQMLSRIQPNGGSTYAEIPVQQYNYKILGQTNDYIIVNQEKMGVFERLSAQSLSEAWGAHNIKPYHSIIYIAINKQTMQSTVLNIKYDCSDVGIFIIEETQSIIYILENIDGSIINIVTYNPSTNQRIILKTVNGTICGISNIIKFKNKYYCLSKNSFLQEGENVQEENISFFFVFSIDFQNNTVTDSFEKIIPYDFCNEVTVANTTEYSYHKKISLHNMNDEYIQLTIHDNLNALFWSAYKPQRNAYQGMGAGNGYIITRNNDVYVQYHASYLMQYNNSTWTIKTQINELQGYKIQGILYYNQYIPIFITSSGILGFKFNQETEVFEQIINKSGNYYTMGLDENNMLYLFDSNDNCETYGKNTVNELKAEFEYESYNYDNQNINSYIKIYAKNFIKDYIKTKVKLTLTGQCYFNQNNQKELITYTDKNGIKNIPITITYGGVLNCDIQELE